MPSPDASNWRVDGPDLSDVIARGPLALPEARLIARQIAASPMCWGRCSMESRRRVRLPRCVSKISSICP